MPNAHAEICALHKSNALSRKSKHPRIRTVPVVTVDTETDTSRVDPRRRLAVSGRISGGCCAGVATLYIDVCGVVLPCPFLRVPCGNVHEAPLITIWENATQLRVLRNRCRFEECGCCEHRDYCGGCRAAALRSCGDLRGRDPNCFRNLKS